MTIDYRRICIPNEIESRPIVNFPIKRDGFVYMTNGHLAIRFDASMPFDPTNPAIPGATHVDEKQVKFLVGIFDGIESVTFGQLPEFVPPNGVETCKTCKSSGLAAICTECGGTCVASCPHCDSEIECDSCDDGVVAGPGAQQVRCEPCRGSGVAIPPYSKTKFGNTWIDYRYLVTVLRFNDVRVAFDPDPTRMIKFSFDGGHAHVMPMRGD